MEELEKMEPSEMIKELIRMGYVLKSAGRGIHVTGRNASKNDQVIKRIIRERTEDLLEYMDKTYPNELLEEILTSLSRVEGYAASTKTLILETLNEKLNELIIDAETCDSPLEFKLLWWLKEYVERFNHSNGTYFWIHNQYPVVANGKNYRVDFMICCVGQEDNPNKLRLVIECDGHDFHEKTKQQAQRDKERDRNLQMAGYRVIHFTGSEVFKDPGKCVREVVEFLETMI